jgi:O-antigen/teichoic acid export membrane protein
VADTHEVEALWETGKVLRFSLPLLLSSLSWIGLLWTDVLFIGYFRPAADAGIYRAASQTALLITIVLGAIGTVFSPMITELYERREIDRLARIFSTSSRWSLVCSLPIFLLFAVTGDEVLAIFGPTFRAGFPALLILGSAQLLSAATGNLSFLLSMTGHQYQVLVGDVVISVANIGLNLLLVPSFGGSGAATATAISIVSLNAFRGVQVFKTLGIQPFGRAFLKPIAAGAIAAAAGLLVSASLGMRPGWLQLTAGGGVAWATYIAALLVLGLSDTDRWVLQRIRVKLIRE